MKLRAAIIDYRVGNIGSVSQAFLRAGVKPHLTRSTADIDSADFLVLPGVGSNAAVFNPMEWRYEAQPAKDSYGKGLESILSAAYPDAFTLIDLRPLRPLVGTWREGTTTYDLMRTVHGFDAVLVLSGSTPSSNLRR